MSLSKSALSVARAHKRQDEPLPADRLGQPSRKLEAEHVLSVLNCLSLMWHWPGFTVEHAGEFLTSERIDATKSAREHTDSLRRYVDLWLATGRQRNGSEIPSSRHPTWRIQGIVERFYRTHYLTPVPLCDGYKLATVPDVSLGELGDESTVLRVPSRGYPKWQTPPSYAPNSPIQKIVEEHYRTKPVRQRGASEEPFTIAEDAAQRMFVGMLLSDWRLKIAKCCKCEAYFLLKHPRRIYSAGTHCAECGRKRSLGSAGKATQHTREAAYQTLWSLAAKRFKSHITTVGWHQNQKLATKVVEFLREQIERDDGLRSVYPQGITPKWLSWAKNRKGIEEAVKKGKHAKS